MFDAPAPPWKPTPVVHVSPATPRAAPLDLASASLGQDGTKLKLVITTRGAYTPAKLTGHGRRVLCLDLVYGHPREKVGLCAGSFARPSGPAPRPARPIGAGDAHRRDGDA